MLTSDKWIAFDATVETVERILLTDYHVYEHLETGIKNVGCEQYHVPKDVQSHIDYITPGIKLMSHGYSHGTYAKARRTRSPEARKRSTGHHNVGPSRLAIPLSPQEIAEAAKLRLNGGCDRYVTAECIKGKARGSREVYFTVFGR